MDAIHIIMATSTSANPHNSPNIHIESLAKKRKLSAVTFLIFGILLIVAGSLLASFEKQRFSVSFIIFGGIGIIFAFMYWISAEKILIALRKVNEERIRQARYYAQHADSIDFAMLHGEDAGRYRSALRAGLPSYEQSIVQRIDIPPTYEEAIKIKSIIVATTDSSDDSTPVPVHTVSLAVDQAAVITPTAMTTTTTTTTSERVPNRKRPAPRPPTH